MGQSEISGRRAIGRTRRPQALTVNGRAKLVQDATSYHALVEEA
jgi:hypothetical protein